MKIQRFLAITAALLGQLSCPLLHSASAKVAAHFTAITVDPEILSPRSTVVLGHSVVQSPGSFAIQGVLVQQTGAWGVFNEAIIQDGNGTILGTSNTLTADGRFHVKFFRPYAVFTNTPTDIVVLGRSTDNLWFAHGQHAGLQTSQFFYDGDSIALQGQYPGGLQRVDAQIYQRARVVFARQEDPQPSVLFNPQGAGLKTVDRFVVNVEYEAVKLWPHVEIMSTGKANPRNIRVALSYGGKTIYGVSRFAVGSNRAVVTFSKPLELPIGKTTVDLKVRLGGSFSGKRSAMFLFNTDLMQALGVASGYPIRVLSDLSPASNTVTSVKVTNSK